MFTAGAAGQAASKAERPGRRFCHRAPVSLNSAGDLLSKVGKLPELRGFTSTLGGDSRSGIMTTDRQAGWKADRPCPPQPGEVIGRILDKGVVIQCHAPVSVLDIGLLGVSSRVSVMTVGRWDLLAAILGVERPGRSKSPGRVRARGRAHGSGRRPGKPRRRLPAEVRPRHCVSSLAACRDQRGDDSRRAPLVCGSHSVLRDPGASA